MSEDQVFTHSIQYEPPVLVILEALRQNWQAVRLGDYCYKPDYGYTASASIIPIGPKFLRITDIQEGMVDWMSVPYCEYHDNNIELLLRSGDIVVARIGATSGKAFLVSDCPKAVFASYLIRIRVKPLLDPLYLYFYFQSDSYWQQIERNKGGRLKGGINIPVLQNLVLPLPTPKEQSAIAHLLLTVQQAIQVRRRELALERERKVTLMQHLFTDGTRGGTAALVETRFGAIPDHWQVQILDQCAYVQTGAAKGRDLSGSRTVQVPYLRVANVQDGYLDLDEMKTITIKESEIERYGLCDGDVVVTEGGDFDKLGRGFIWKAQLPLCIHQNHVFAVRPDRSRLTPDFLAYLFQSQYGKAYFLSVAHRTTNLASINSEKLKAFPVALPPLDEQIKIVKVLNCCDVMLASIGREITLLDELFRAFLEDLMSGRLSTLPLIEAGLAPV